MIRGKKKPNSPTKIYIICLWISLLFSIFSILCFSENYLITAPFNTLDKIVLDDFMVRRNSSKLFPVFRRYHDQFLIIQIDDNSLKELGRFPWPRSTFTSMINKIESMGPKSILMDVLFTEESENKNEDFLLAKTIAKYDNIFFPLSYKYSGMQDSEIVISGSNLSLKEKKITDTKNKLEIILPLNKFFEKICKNSEFDKLKLQMGFVGIDPDRDGMVRNAPLLYPTVPPLYLIDLLVAFHYKNIPIQNVPILYSNGQLKAGDMKIPLHNRFLPINYGVEKYRGSYGEYTYMDVFSFCDCISFSEFLKTDTESLKTSVKDKIILIGATAVSLTDIKATPLGKMPGIYIHSNIILSLIENRFLWYVPVFYIIGFIFLSAIIISFISRKFKIITRTIIVLTLIMGFLLGSYHLFCNSGAILQYSIPICNILACFFASSIYEYRKNEQEKNEIKTLFGGYLSPKVIEHLVDAKRNGALALDGKREKVSILYSDIRGFTSISEKLQPEEVVGMLNRYFEEMSSIAVSNEGYIDKFIGDCMMVVFSAPFSMPDDSKRAVKTAILMQKRLNELNIAWGKEGKTEIQVGMGINTGYVILGNIGSKYKMDYTVIGDAVNLAARLYATAKPGQILISQSTFDEIKELYKIKELGKIKVKGKEEEVNIYEVEY